MIQNELELFYVLSNKHRIHILKELSDQELSLNQIASSINSSNQVAQKHTKQLISSMLVEKTNGKFCITSFGQIIIPHMRTFEFLGKAGNFFAYHTLGDAGIQLSHKLGSLLECEFVDGIPACFSRWKQVVESSKRYLYCIFTYPPILVADRIIEKISDGISLKIIFGQNSHVYECNELVDKLQLTKNNCQIPFEKRMIKNSSINMILSDRSACLMFPDREGNTDMRRSFTSTDEEFCNWCLDFFNLKWAEGEPFSRLRSRQKPAQ